MLETTHRQIDKLNVDAASLHYSDSRRILLLASKAETLSRSLDPIYEKGLAESLFSQALIQIALKDDYESGLDLIREAQSVYDSEYDIQFLSGIYFLYGLISFAIGDYEQSFKQHLTALSHAEETNNQQRTIQVQEVLGTLYHHIGDYDQAISYYDLVLEYHKTQEKQALIALVRSKMSRTLQSKGNLEEAFQNAHTAVEICERIQASPVILTQVYGALSEAYVSAENYQKALDIEHKRLDLPLSEAPKLQSQALRCIGTIHNQLSQYEVALAWLQRGLMLATGHKFKPEIYAYHQQLATAYKGLEQFDLALDHHEKFHTIKEEVFGERALLQIRHLEITHRTEITLKELNQQKALREQEQAYFDELNRLKDDYISTAAHDLKTPLSTILTSLYLLSRHGIVNDEKGKDYFKRINKQIDRMQQLISTLLDLSQLEMDGTLTLRSVSITHFLKDIVHDFELLANQKSIFLQAVLPDERLNLYVDTDRMTQVFNNLIGNAIKYTPRTGQVTVSLSREGHAVLIEVADTGLGIPADELPHIFKRFYRVGDAKQSKKDGTGLGLSIVKTIVEQHGGKVWVESTYGVGSNFYVRLPMPSDGKTKDNPDSNEKMA